MECIEYLSQKEREKYEDLKYDLFNKMEYWHIKQDIKDWNTIEEQDFKYLINVEYTFYLFARESGFYYYTKGAYIYFTYKKEKYCISLTFLDVNIIDFLEHSLETLNATDIYINTGEID